MVQSRAATSAPPRWARARAACRVDFAGGTLDIWPLGLLHRGAQTVNTAIDIEVSAELERRREGYLLELDGRTHLCVDRAGVGKVEGGELIGEAVDCLLLPPCRIRLGSESPLGAGLGASSALMIALLAAGDALAANTVPPPEQAARRARDLEAHMMALPTGMQDHFPALLGGVLAIEQHAGGERVERLAVDLDPLDAALVLAYTGRSHFSAANNWQVVRRRLDGDPQIIEALERVSRSARKARAALENGNLRGLGECMSEEWKARATLAEGVSTPEIETMLDAAAGAGAWGGKACGAGGGGCVAILGPPERRAKIEMALEAVGADLLPARATPHGLRVESGDGPMPAGRESGDRP